MTLDTGVRTSAQALCVVLLVPLGAGTFAVSIPQTATGTARFNFDFTVTAVP